MYCYRKKSPHAAVVLIKIEIISVVKVLLLLHLVMIVYSLILGLLATQLVIKNKLCFKEFDELENVYLGIVRIAKALGVESIDFKNCLYG